MTYDSVLNFFLFLSRVATLFLTLVLFANLWSDWRERHTKNENGLGKTRVAIMILVLSLLAENTLYGIGYIHSGFDTAVLNQWLTLVKPLLILARWGVFYGVLKLFTLFCCGKKE